MNRVLPQVGDRITILHTCRRDPSKAAHDGNLVDHARPVTVERVVNLNSGGLRVEATRCDGSRVHVIYDAAGVEQP